jgi:glucose-6-phosphate isomerase
VHVLMPYGDALEPLSRWYVQLAGESLGKRRPGSRRGVGPTPLPARGATDQHSQLQLFVEGPPDKLVVFVDVARPRRRVALPGTPPAPYLKGVSAGQLLRAEREGTAVALARAGRPSLTWELPAAAPECIGQLLFALQLQTAYQAALYGIDAYDQPGVEAGKVAANALIGRAGYEAERAAIEAGRPPDWRI